MDSIVPINPVIMDGNLKVHDELNIDILKKKIAAEEGPGGERKRTVSSTKSANTKSSVMWPEFKIPVPDPELGNVEFTEFIESLIRWCIKFVPSTFSFEGFTGEIFSGKGGLTPEQSLVEFISTSASFHGVKKQTLRTLEWDLLKVIMIIYRYVIKLLQLLFF